MKRMICYFLLCGLILVCIAGCISGQPGESTDPSGSTSLQGSQSQGTLDPGFTVPTYDLETLPTVEREKTGALIDYDPNRELYILTGQNDIIYYLGEGGVATYYGFLILSKKPLDISSMSVEVGIEHPYEVRIKEIDLEGIADCEEDAPPSSSDGNQFPYALYQCYQGKDFRKLAELEWELDYWRKVMSQCYSLQLEEKMTQEEVDVYKEKYEAAKAAYLTYRNAELEDYRTLEKADLPTFYVYYARIEFSPMNVDISAIPDEVLTEIAVTIGDQVYHQQIGQITLTSGKREVMDRVDWHNGIENVDDGILGWGDDPLPYNDGLHEVELYFHITADRYKTLTNLVLNNPAHRLEAVWIDLKPEGGSWSTYKWDLSEPFELYPGDEAKICVIYSDDYLDSFLGYATKLDGYLEYESDGETWYKVCNCYVSESMNYYALYALIFDGIDMESYYWDYYYVFQQAWRYDLEVDPFTKV